MVDILKGAMSGLQAISLGKSDRRQDDFMEMKKTAFNQGQQRQQDTDRMAQEITDRWNQNDIRGFKAGLAELSAVDNNRAKELFNIFGTLDRSNFTEASIALYGSAALPDSDIDAKNKVLDQSIEAIGIPDHPFNQFLNNIKALPAGEERTAMELEGLEFAKMLGGLPGSGKERSKKQKTGAWMMKDDQGKYKLLAGSYDTDTGAMGISGAAIPEGYEPVSKLGETPEETRKRKIETTAGVEHTKQAIKSSASFAKEYNTIKASMPIYDEVLNLLDDAIKTGKWTGTGPIAQYIPKMNSTAIHMETLGNQLGLRVIQSATFGALNKEELKMAMATGLPRGLKPKALKVWVGNKKKATEKYSNFLAEAASFIGSEKPGGGVYTESDWLNRQKKIHGFKEYKSLDEVEKDPDYKAGKIRRFVVGNDIYEVD